MVLFLLSRGKIREVDEDRERGENWSRECLRGRDHRNPASRQRDACFPPGAFFPNQDPLRSTAKVAHNLNRNRYRGRRGAGTDRIREEDDY